MGKKITELNTRTNLLNTDFLPVAIEGETFKTPIQSIKNKLLLENNTYTGNNIFTGENTINNIDFNDKSTKIINSNFVKTNLSPKCQIIKLEYIEGGGGGNYLTIKAGSTFAIVDGVEFNSKKSRIITLNRDLDIPYGNMQQGWATEGDTSSKTLFNTLIFLLKRDNYNDFIIALPDAAFTLNGEKFSNFKDESFVGWTFPDYNIDTKTNFIKDLETGTNYSFCFIGTIKHNHSTYSHSNNRTYYDFDEYNFFNGNFYEMDALELKKIFEKNKKYVPDIKKPIINIPLTDTGQVKMMPADGILCMSASFGSNGGYIKMIYCDAEGDPLNGDMGCGDHNPSAFKAIASIPVAKGQYIYCVYNHNNIVGSPTLKLLQF